MRKWSHILVHHSAGKDTLAKDTLEFRRQHRAKGWADIGYHAVVECVGNMLIVAPGRPETMDGAHCPGMNKKALGICLAGNFSEAAPDAAILELAADQVARWCQVYEIPVENIHRHSDHRATECPGKLFDIEAFRLLVSYLLDAEPHAIGNP